MLNDFDVKKIRQDFPIIKKSGLIYFDNSATSLKPKCVIDEVVNYYEEETTNIDRGDYPLSFEVSKKFQESRVAMAKFINAASNEIIFTSGATDAINMFAYGYLINHLKEGDVVLTSLLEHASTVLPLFDICKKTGAKLEYIELEDDGRFNLENYQRQLTDRVKAVVITHISNVLGYINPIKKICSLAHSKNAIVMVDGAQSVPHIRVDVKELGVDFLAIAGHKMLAPNGLGILYGKYELLLKMEPVKYGGGSNARFDKEMNLVLKDVPKRFESGTPQIEQVLALHKAIDYYHIIGFENIEKQEELLRDYLIEKLKKMDNVIIYNDKTDIAIVSFNFKGIFAQDAASYLGSKNICVRSGNHCAKIMHNVIGTNESIRASLFFYNTKEEIDEFIAVCQTVTIENCISIIL